MIAVVIPTLNERDNVEPLVIRITQCEPPPNEIIFVDDGSTDGTRDRVRALMTSHPVRLIERDGPELGLAGAVIAGARAAEADILVVMDADLSHPPEKISELVRPLNRDAADMVIGSRYVQGGSTPGWPFWRKIMSRVAAAAAFPITRVHDSMCGFFAIRRGLLLELAPAATGFKIAFETIVGGGGKLRVLEVPIVFRDRARGTSKMSFGIALVFFFRWLAALSHIRSRRNSVVNYEARPAAAELTRN
jgi:dolichol-phosphate mannosyltransferase